MPVLLMTTSRTASMAATIRERHENRDQAHVQRDRKWLLDFAARLAVENVEQRVLGHGEGQEHAIDDVNAGRVDDMIAPRLRVERDKACEFIGRDLKEAMERVLTLELDCQRFRAALQEYLDWGAMTGPDQDLFEQKFRVLLTSTGEPGLR